MTHYWWLLKVHQGQLNGMSIQIELNRFDFVQSKISYSFLQSFNTLLTCPCAIVQLFLTIVRKIDSNVDIRYSSKACD